MPEFKIGDIFRLDMPGGKSISGRVILDLYRQCLRPGKIGTDSPLAFVGRSILLDFYKEFSTHPVRDGATLLIPGCFVDSGPLQSGSWPIVGYETVEPTAVDFPEGLVNRGSEPYFVRGEVTLPLRLEFHDAMRINVFITRVASSKLPIVCERYLAGDTSSVPNLSTSDLRFSPHRNEVYSALGEDPKEPYYVFSQRHGFDLARFYEGSSKKSKRA